jgi:probable rRNA maturation factor
LNITIVNRQRRHPVRRRSLRRAAEKILSGLGYCDSELSVVIVGDRAIRSLNRDYLGRDKPTNVISFAMQEGDFSGLNPQMLGDVLISADTAAREAEEGGETFEERLYFLLLHGILHLAGYDHERSGAAESRRMAMKERKMFAMLQNEGLVERGMK